MIFRNTKQNACEQTVGVPIMGHQVIDYDACRYERAHNVHFVCVATIHSVLIHFI